MCYEFSEWSWKLRAARSAQKERAAAPSAKKASEPPAPAKPAPAEPRVREEKIPA